ncbi:MAG: hypothetical protein COT81_04305 [Candidatus Buchananbacteria bacterium CG10_big_fil_rev_8_21_14_0_10_42_9]|uniref:Aminoglycoside phosphotransferase domain-containing protein n=1 Tax=Candidatus Buchananbacteria bacterium CG10_big_fil_rev_8_21_14_0_10_42_9 TaxID=1974526 RepID=A0A2H0W2W1_9BACT|nr:MAG: hypothetical protein COT81_04305 [Candidatus Buchananbacteria bacterium CG10_big_fil_rev_8_21_14_0_10_42_9]
MATALGKTILKNNFKVDTFFDQAKMLDYFDRRLNDETIAGPLKLSLKRFKKYNRRAVVRYELSNANKQQLIVFCSAAGDGSRKKTFEILKYFFDHNITTQKPLWYDKRLKGMFYISAEGDNLYQYIQGQKNIDAWVEKAGLKLSQIHGLKPLRKLKLKKIDFKNQIDPENVLRRYKKNWPKETSQAIAFKKRLFAEIDKIKPEKKTLCHGDFHPENIIIQKQNHKIIDVIDFTDTGLCDPAYDLGSFMQQLDFMSRIYTPAAKIEKLQQQFFNTYLSNRNIAASDELIYKITLFQILTALKSAIFFMPSLKKPKKTAINFLLQEIEILFKKIS